MGISDCDELLREYTGRITGHTDEASLIKSVPWSLGGPGDLSALLKGLQLEAARLCELPHQLTYSLIVPMTNTPPRFLNDLVLSVRCQSWFQWELILIDDGSERREHLPLAARWAEEDARIRFLTMDRRRGRVAAKNAALEAAAGEFACVIDDRALLHPSALGIFARQLNAEPAINLIFSHEARLEEGSTRIRKYIRKPDLDLFTLLRKNYIGNLTAIRTELLLAVRNAGKVFRPGYDGVEDHDLMIRLARSGKVESRSLPFYLYYSRNPSGRHALAEETDPDIRRMTLNLIEEYLPEIYPGARWAIVPPSPLGGNQYPGIHLRSLPDHPNPSLLVIMPFKDQPEMTLRCLDSIERQEHELDIEVVMVNQRSRDPQTKRVLQSWMDRPRRYRYRIHDHEGAFNYARMNNGAFEKFGRDKDLLLLLNNDTEIFSVDCFQTMAMQALADEHCGVVGMRLLYPDDGSVQHGGMKIWDNVLAVCGFHQVDHSRRPEEYVNDERIAFGVTFAIAMMRRTTFERLGMLEEVVYPNAFGDVAFCAKAIEAGLKNYYFGTLIGLHYEMKTRGRCHEDVEYVAVAERYSRVCSHWMLRSLSYSEFSESSQSYTLQTSSTGFASPSGFAPGAYPLRYRVADRINSTIKSVLGPAHPVVKSGIHRSWHMLRGFHAGINRLRPKNRVGWLKRSRAIVPDSRRPHLNLDVRSTHNDVLESDEAIR
ncbi:MAG: glycosyltransferase family 2 protein [Isosphaeraceae bacterium]